MTPDLHKTLSAVSTASIASALLKAGLRNIWIRGAAPMASNGARAVGEAFTLRFLPMREDLTGAALAKLGNSRAAIEAAEAGCIIVIDAMGVVDAGVAGDVLCARMAIASSAVATVRTAKNSASRSPRYAASSG